MKFTDQTGHAIQLKDKPKRIISIVPSQSELLWDLGLEKELVGITKFCVHPDKMYRSVERVGGTKKLDIHKIRLLKPDLIIGNKEENEQSQIEELRKEFPVWMSDIYDLSDAFDMISSLAEITGKKNKAEQLIKTIKNNFEKLDLKKFKGKKVAYFIWYNPFMVAAQNTFIDYILEKLGMINVFEYLTRYPKVNAAQIKGSVPDYIFLSSEPFPFKEKHIEELKQISPDSEVILIDGELFSWYGSRLQYAPAYFERLQL
ncbi:MAG TPA: helical backbone metal receptor [Bacteroidia bacterium]|jgi:ABC-type Fe3+-hydroxamate transport system substrate-binding protein|nr:helical backbone metal receptor [Bacteroidia bacterium]